MFDVTEKEIEKIYYLNFKGDFRTYDINDWYSKIDNKVIIKSFKILDIVFPITFRKVLGVKKEIIPASLSILLNFLCNIHGKNIQLGSKQEIFNKILEVSISENSYRYWTHPYSHHGKQWPDKLSSQESCLHHNIACGLSIVNLYKISPSEKLKNILIEIVNNVNENHNWNSYEDSLRVSYYPSTNDEVINIIAEYCLLLVELHELGIVVSEERINKLLKTIIMEQKETGIWWYGTDIHYNKYNDSKIIDSHHTNMIINALINIYKYDGFKSVKLKEVIKKSFASYNKNFINGNMIKKYHNRNIDSIITGYLDFFKMNIYYNNHIETLTDKKKLYSIYDRFSFLFLNNGRPTSARHFGFNYTIDSIRYGYGALLEFMSIDLND